MELFENEVITYMTQQNMLTNSDRIGVAVSGGADSMALLRFMNELSKMVDISIVAVHVNHGLRKAARKDAAFVRQYCADNKIECVTYNVNVNEYIAKEKVSLEQGARILRYQCFETAAKKYKLTKFALAHHLNDQAETILLHIFRGCGLEGVSGMSPINGIYIRPFLNVKKTDLIAYNYRNGTPNIEDESNDDNKFSRNFIRNVVMPELKKEWRNVEDNIVSFGKIAQTDNKYINELADTNGIIKEYNTVRIPLNRFAFPLPIVSRLIFKCCDMLNIRQNIEMKHIQSIIDTGVNGLNGEKCDLPNNSYAVREYEYMTIVKREKKNEEHSYPFKIGKTVIASYGTVLVTKTLSYKLARDRGLLVVDAEKLPKKARWRFKADGDQFTKFGGGTKSLSAFLVDKKVPARLRSTLPVLALGSDILIVGGIEISEKIKCDRETTDAFVCEFTKE
jgi:tRNA(Ile)-lysidine synthase